MRPGAVVAAGALLAVVAGCNAILGIERHDLADNSAGAGCPGDCEAGTGGQGGSAGATAGTVAGTAAGSSAGTSAGTTAGTTAGSLAGTGAGSGAGVTAGGAAGTTAGTVAGTTAGAAAGSTAGTTAGTTAGVTAGTMAGTSAGTTAGTIAGTSEVCDSSIPTTATCGGVGCPASSASEAAMCLVPCCTASDVCGQRDATTGATTACSSGPRPPGCTAPPAELTFDISVVRSTGPDGNYTIYQPAVLGTDGFLHPPLAWGSGMGAQPSDYDRLLLEVAAHGFVVIANNGPGSDAQTLRDGLEWLIAQDAAGAYAGLLAVDCAAAIGHSEGGGAALGAGAHPAVKAVVSIHGTQGASENASGPVLLTTSEDDAVVSKDLSEMSYIRSTVQPTVMASHTTGTHDHPIPDGGEDAPPMIAWLRYWIYGDENQRDWFFGPSCTLCSWPDLQRKNHDWN